MLHNPPLLTIHRGYRRQEQALLEAFRGAQTSHLCDAMDGRGALDYRIKPLDPDNAVFAGSALTAFAYPADSVGMLSGSKSHSGSSAYIRSMAGTNSSAWTTSAVWRAR